MRFSSSISSLMIMNLMKSIVKKVIVSDDGYAVMALPYDGRLTVWRNGDEDWTAIDGFNSDPGDEDWIDGFNSVGDIIYHRGNFYAICKKNLLITVDPKSLDVTKIGSYEIPSGKSRYLVKSNNDMFFFIKCEERKYVPYCDGMLSDDDFNYKETVGFCALKFDNESNEFVPPADAFRERVVFFGDDFAFSLPAKEFPRLSRNCIYLEDECFDYLREDDEICLHLGEDESMDYLGEDDSFDSLDEDDETNLLLGEGDLYFNRDYNDYNNLSSDENVRGYSDQGLSIGVYDLGKKTAAPLSIFSDTIFWPPPSWLKSGSGPSRG